MGGPRRTSATSTTASARSSGRGRSSSSSKANGNGVESESSSRARVIAATIDCINELGYYQATSNEIARRAGVSWGVIQYHFGTREKLLVAVIEDACATTLRELDEVVITGDTVAERLAIWMDEAFAFYSQPSYLAILQILWDVMKRPATTAESVRTLIQWQGDVVAKQQELLTRVAGDKGAEHVNLLFPTMWGFSVAQATARWHADLVGPAPEIKKDELVEAFAWLLERETPKKQSGAKKRTTARASRR